MNVSIASIFGESDLVNSFDYKGADSIFLDRRRAFVVVDDYAIRELAFQAFVAKSIKRRLKVDVGGVVVGVGGVVFHNEVILL